MNIRSAKNKGKRLQNWVRDAILKLFPTLQKDDVKSTVMGDSGEDVQLSPAARLLFPFAIECKNREADSGIWKAWDQCIVHATKAGATINPVMIFKKNGKSPLAIIDAELFLSMAAKTGNLT